MSTLDLSSIVDNYYAWLKDSTFIDQMNNNTVRISLPFLDRNNDYTEIYVIKNSENDFILTDDGETYRELEFSGFKFNKERLKILNNILMSHGISIDGDNAIYVNANTTNIYFKKHMMVQCLTRISDLFVSSIPQIRSLFTEDISNFFDENDIRYTSNIPLIGKSKLNNNFDFLITKSKNAPERLIRGLNKLDVQNAKLLMFSWGDVRETREAGMQLITFVNDIDKKIHSVALSGLSEYGITPVLWSDRSKALPMLAA